MNEQPEAEPAFDWYSHVDTHVRALVAEVFGELDGQPTEEGGVASRLTRLEQVVMVQTGAISALLLVVFAGIWWVSR
jgi:hypothetical protein